MIILQNKLDGCEVQKKQKVIRHKLYLLCRIQIATEEREVRRRGVRFFVAELVYERGGMMICKTNLMAARCQKSRKLCARERLLCKK